MRNLRIQLITLLCVLITIPSYSQIEVTGNVTSEDGPVPGASVLEKGTTNGTVTDIDGNFRLTVQSDTSVLLVSFIGYKAQEITVGSQSNFEVFLKDDAVQLEEVVVIGYGEQQKSVSTGSISSVGRYDI